LVGILSVTDVDSGTVTVNIQQSADNVTFANILGFVAVSAAAAPTAQRLTLSGAILRYLRVSTTGTFSNCDFCMVTRRGTLQDDVSLNP